MEKVWLFHFEVLSSTQQRCSTSCLKYPQRFRARFFIIAWSSLVFLQLQSCRSSPQLLFNVYTYAQQTGCNRAFKEQIWASHLSSHLTTNYMHIWQKWPTLHLKLEGLLSRIQTRRMFLSYFNHLIYYIRKFWHRTVKQFETFFFLTENRGRSKAGYKTTVDNIYKHLWNIN